MPESDDRIRHPRTDNGGRRGVGGGRGCSENVSGHQGEPGSGCGVSLLSFLLHSIISTLSHSFLSVLDCCASFFFSNPRYHRGRGRFIKPLHYFLPFLFHPGSPGDSEFPKMVPPRSTQDLRYRLANRASLLTLFLPLLCFFMVSSLLS